jgi:hypothetical protein
MQNDSEKRNEPKPNLQTLFIYLSTDTLIFFQLKDELLLLAERIGIITRSWNL